MKQANFLHMLPSRLCLQTEDPPLVGGGVGELWMTFLTYSILIVTKSANVFQW